VKQKILNDLNKFDLMKGREKMKKNYHLVSILDHDGLLLCWQLLVFKLWCKRWN